MKILYKHSAKRKNKFFYSFNEFRNDSNVNLNSHTELNNQIQELKYHLRYPSKPSKNIHILTNLLLQWKEHEKTL